MHPKQSQYNINCWLSLDIISKTGLSIAGDDPEPSFIWGFDSVAVFCAQDFCYGDIGDFAADVSYTELSESGHESVHRVGSFNLGLIW